MSLKIGSVELKSNIILAPMAGYSDYAFRKMCLDYGAGLVCTEMVSSSALHFRNKKTEDLLITFDGEYPKAVQLFGHNPEYMAEAGKKPLLQKCDIIDINMGCPARKIISNGDGSALLNDFELAEKIIKSCVDATDKPITVKFRIGYTDDNIVGVEFAKMCERAGASAITVHGRTTSQGYSGTVNLEVIKKIKQSVSIPVFANGDCKSVEDAEKILNETSADGIMIGRGALGCPEIFQSLNLHFYNKLYQPNEIYSTDRKNYRFEQIKFHYNSLLKSFGEIYVAKFMRSHLAYYLSGKYKNTKLLVELLKMEKIEEILNKLSLFIK